MANNHNVGIGGLGSGLVLQSKPEIDCNEFGLQEATLKFWLYNNAYPTFVPKRGTPVTSFLTDVASKNTLTGISFLGCQTTRWTRGIGSNTIGVGTLEVHCQGAVFTDGLIVRSAAIIAVTYGGIGYTSMPTLQFSGGGQRIQAGGICRLGAHNVGLFSGGSGYTVGDVLTVSGGVANSPAKIVVDTLGGGGAVSGFHFQDRGYYLQPPSGISSVTGGTGTGAQFTIEWNVRVAFVTIGGEYTGTPSLAFVGGGYTANERAEGIVIMGAPRFAQDKATTSPFKPVTTVKDTVQFNLFGATSSGSSTLQARVATTSLPFYIHGIYSGYDGIAAAGNGVLPPQDGVTLNIGDKVLVADNTPFAGHYKVAQIGSDPIPFQGGGSPWILIRMRDMDTGAEITNSVYINVAEGDQNSGQWRCTVQGAVTLNVTPITFDLIGQSSAKNVPSHKVTIDYHAIELHFEYMANAFASKPRFILDEYQRNDDGNIIIDPATNPPTTMALDIDSVLAIEQIATTDASGNVTVTDGAAVAIDEDTWRSAVKYLGTSAQFEQIPSGAYYHVREQATIKIVPIVAVGTVVSG